MLKPEEVKEKEEKERSTSCDAFMPESIVLRNYSIKTDYLVKTEHLLALVLTVLLRCIECMRCRLLLPMCTVTVSLSICLSRGSSRLDYAGVSQCSLCPITLPLV